MKLNLLECSAVVQGEGKYAGIPHILIRTTGCRLRCMFKDSICDTAFASWFPEKGVLTLEDIRKFYKDHPKIRYTMITGGGPTLNPDVLISLVNIAKKEFYHFVTIETEGSEFVDTDADFISLSPKLSSSTPREGVQVNNTSLSKPHIVTKEDIEKHELWRKSYPAMEKFLYLHRFDDGYQVKFVISNLEKDIEEISEIQKILNFPDRRIYLMPEGLVNEQLQVRRQKIIEKCIERGWNYSDRLHVVAYGNRRGV